MIRPSLRPGITLAALVAILGCDTTSEPTPADIDGQWHSLTFIATEDPHCFLRGSLVLTQSGRFFSGVYTGGQWDCQGHVAINQLRDIRDGVVDGHAVRFRIAAPDVSFDGRLVQGLLTGTATWRLPIGKMVDGPWSAARVPDPPGPPPPP